MNNRKYPPGPEIETIERLMKKRDDLQEENKHLRDLLRRCNNIMPACPICKGNLKTWERLSYNESKRVGHVIDCELEEELGE